ncbi:MAG: DNA repair protein RecO [Bacteroidales bacterium]|nr:DNA repair protein RecO [Bacteroidales bacterium]
MLYKTKGIVLNSFKYGDSSVVVHIYTRDFGRQAYLVNGVRGKTGKFRFNNFQPLTILDLQVDHKPMRELQRLRELHIAQPFYHIYTNIVKNTIALFIGEVLYRCVNDTEGNKPMFDYIESAVQVLDICSDGYANFHLLFLIHFTRFLGIFPENSNELDNFQPVDASFKVHSLINFALNEPYKLFLSNTLRVQLVIALIDYYRYHLEGMGKINSLEVLHEVFA